MPGDREKNVLLTADYSQIELRMLAHFTREPALLRAFEADEDIHRAVAAEVFGVPLEQVTREQRGQAKIDQFRHRLWRQRVRAGPANRRDDAFRRPRN